MTTIEVPNFWTFRLPCSCPFGSVRAIQMGQVLATEEQAWSDFYDTKRERVRAERQGVYVTPADEFDVERWKAGHSHPDCSRVQPKAVS